MKIFRNHYAGQDDGSIGYSWFASESEALRHHLDDKENNRPIRGDPTNIAVPFDIPTDKPGILRFLNAHASHPDNG